jgi:hypothetical protein
LCSGAMLVVSWAARAAATGMATRVGVARWVVWEVDMVVAARIPPKVPAAVGAEIQVAETDMVREGE